MFSTRKREGYVCNFESHLVYFFRLSTLITENKLLSPDKDRERNEKIDHAGEKTAKGVISAGKGVSKVTRGINQVYIKNTKEKSRDLSEV
jgi:hypothetical protein